MSRPLGDAPFVNDGGESLGGSVSADGRFVAFSSVASGLGAVDGTGPSVFVRDVLTGAVTLVSRQDGQSGAPMHGATDPRISADGRRVAFVGADGQNVVAMVLQGSQQVYVRDLPSGRTILVSSADGASDVLGDDNSSTPSISDDGARVAFISQATNLGDGDADSQADVHLREVDGGSTLLIDRADGANGAKGDIRRRRAPMISGDGRHVVFSSGATNLGDGDTDALLDVHVRDVDAGTTRLVSANGEQTKGDRTSFGPSISRDGARVAFLSRAANFGQPGEAVRLYVRDLSARTLTLAGRGDGAAGAPIADDISDPLLSADGGHVAFVAGLASVLVPGDLGDGIRRAYVRDLASGATRLVSRRSGVDGAPEDGRRDRRHHRRRRLRGLRRVRPARAAAAQRLRGRVPARRRSELRPAGCRSPTEAWRCPAVLSGLSVKPGRFHVGGRRGGDADLVPAEPGVGGDVGVRSSAAGASREGEAAGEGEEGKRSLLDACAQRSALHGREAGRALAVDAEASARRARTRVKFCGKLGRKALAPGRYRLTATPSRGKGRECRFVVVKAPKHSKHERADR